MKAGLACPYSWEGGPGGVQEHIRDPAGNQN